MSSRLSSRSPPTTMEDSGAAGGRWVQINNTVVPVVQRTKPDGVKLSYIPLPVVRHGASLFTDRDPEDVVRCTVAERRLLSHLCLDAGFKFEFPADTDLMLLDDVTRRYRSRVYVTELPDRDPFMHAEFWSESDNGSALAKRTPPSPSPRAEGRTSSSSCLDKSRGKDIPVENRHRRNLDLEKLNEKKPCRGIWRPVSFSPERLHQSKQKPPLGGGTDAEQPLDLSVRGCKKLKKEAVVESADIKKKSTVQATDKSDKEDTRQPSSLHLQDRYLMGHQIVTIERGKVEYVSLASLRLIFFPTLTLDAFVGIVETIESRTQAKDFKEKTRAKGAESRDQYSPSSGERMIPLKDAERILLAVGTFLHAMASYHQPAPIVPWSPLLACATVGVPPGPGLLRAPTARPLPLPLTPLNESSRLQSPIFDDGMKYFGSSDLRDLASWSRLDRSFISGGPAVKPFTEASHR